MESSHGIIIGPNDTQERSIAGQGALMEEMPPKSPGTLPMAAQPIQAEKRGSYICIPLPSETRLRTEQKSLPSIGLSRPPVVPEARTITPPSSAVFGSLRPVIEDMQSLDKDELVRKLRAKTRECEELQQRNRILTLERDEYIEALRISEGLRRV